MTAYYIKLGAYDRIDLKSSQVDPMCYDNNEGYGVWAVSMRDPDGNEVREYFASREARDQFIEDERLVTRDFEVIYDVDTWYITADNGDWTEEIPCKCDVNVAYC